LRFVGLDPSTKTGFVALGIDGEVLEAEELQGNGEQDPERMVTLIDDVMAKVQAGDVICIEGFGFNSQKGFHLGGIGWGIRMGLYRRQIPYIEVTPAQLKKFATGKGVAKKDELAVAIFKRWGFESSSDNVRDAYILAQIARHIYALLNDGKVKGTKGQYEVIKAILENKPDRKKKGRRGNGREK